MSDNTKNKVFGVLILILVILLAFILFLNYCYDNSFWNETLIIPTLFLLAGIGTILTAYYKQAESNNIKKLCLGVGSSLLISGLLEIIALPTYHDWCLILLRAGLLVITTFMSLFIADAIK